MAWNVNKGYKCLGEKSVKLKGRHVIQLSRLSRAFKACRFLFGMDWKEMVVWVGRSLFS